MFTRIINYWNKVIKGIVLSVSIAKYYIWSTISFSVAPISIYFAFSEYPPSIAWLVALPFVIVFVLLAMFLSTLPNRISYK